MWNAPELSYPAQAVRDHDRDRFLAALFIPGRLRETWLTLLALNVEMKHVHRAVSEETLGHIRYAWWEEGVQAIADGQKPREHPVLAALTPETAAAALPLVQHYRSHYPQLPPDADGLLNDLTQALIQNQPGWKKARSVIARHRQKYGQGWNGWLAVKLLWVGIKPPPP